MQKDKQTVFLARKHAEGQDDRNTGEGTRRRAGRHEYHRMNMQKDKQTVILARKHAEGQEDRIPVKVHAEGQADMNIIE
jgi:hypothetical protein